MARPEWELLQFTFSSYLGGESDSAEAAALFEVAVPAGERQNLAALLTTTQLSYRDGAVIQLAYKICDMERDPRIRHVGARTIAQELGKFFASNHIAHVGDAFQNIGKNSAELVRGNLKPWDEFLTWAVGADKPQIEASFNYACSRIAMTARPVLPMPDLNIAKLTFAAAMDAFQEMLSTPSQGINEQFIIASLLDALVQQNGPPQTRVLTKKVNVSDKSSQVAGDIQIMSGSRIIEAFEVTTADWKIKLVGVGEKMKEHDLTRIHVVAPIDARAYAGIAQDLLKLPEDISVIDVRSFAAVLTSALLRKFRAIALNRLYECLDRLQEDIGRVNAYVELVERRGLTLV